MMYTSRDQTAHSLTTAFFKLLHEEGLAVSSPAGDLKPRSFILIPTIKSGHAEVVVKLDSYVTVHVQRAYNDNPTDPDDRHYQLTFIIAAPHPRPIFTVWISHYGNGWFVHNRNRRNYSIVHCPAKLTVWGTHADTAGVHTSSQFFTDAAGWIS
jgi:hypothetical protein